MISHGQITPGRITRVLVVGFTLVILLLVFGGIVLLHNVTSIRMNANQLVTEQSVTRHLIEELQNQQQTLSAIFYTITGDPDTADPEVISTRLRQADGELQRMELEAAPTGEERALWNELRQASSAFGGEARRLLSEADPSNVRSRDLFRMHEQVISIIYRLASKGYRRVAQVEADIRSRATTFDRESLGLLLATLFLATICSVVTVRMSNELFRRMAWQEGELAQISWQMLADQESIARRFSHELHDELGQVLAAVKANLAAVPRAENNAARLKDTTNLVDDAIGNVRQLSQLLRPMILDDFGLDAGLNWLCEGFMQRTGVVVNYESNFHGRLPDGTETHLFRIAQEALTNVARHSGATKVAVELHAAEDQIRLTIADNGKGIASAEAAPAKSSLGMSGMRARARTAGGTFLTSRPDGGGLKLEASIPVKEQNEPDPNPAG